MSTDHSVPCHGMFCRISFIKISSHCKKACASFKRTNRIYLVANIHSKIKAEKKKYLAVSKPNHPVEVLIHWFAQSQHSNKSTQMSTHSIWTFFPFSISLTPLFLERLSNVNINPLNVYCASVSVFMWIAIHSANTCCRSFWCFRKTKRKPIDRTNQFIACFAHIIVLCYD